MKKILYIALPILLVCSKTLNAQYVESMDYAVAEVNELHRPACGYADGGFTSIGTSMLGWGVGLFIAIALVTGLVHSSDHDKDKKHTK